MTAATHNDHLTDRQFAEFSAVISAHPGIKMPPQKKVMLQSRLHRRLRDVGLPHVRAYYDWFFSDPQVQDEELEHLLNLATTNKTDFFREAEHFDFLARQVLPEWRQRPKADTFRVWSAGCATGEEAYTMAITLLEEQARAFFPFTILATDVSTKVLRAAMDAIYPEEHANPIPPPLRAKYVLRGKDRKNRLIRMAPEVRACVRFGKLNFLAPNYGLVERWDVVFFRNVMIYFERPTQQQIVAQLCRHLQPGG